MVAEKACSKCQETKPLEDFRRDARLRDGRRSQCRDCGAEFDRRYQPNNRVRISETGRKYREANRGQIAVAKRRWREVNREEIRARKQQYYEATREYQLAQKRQYRIDNLEQEREQDRLYCARVKAIILGHYGEQCACCGSAELLSVDHINGNGALHREELFGDSRNYHAMAFYRWIIDNDFPDDLQVLCKSCNSSKGTGECCRLAHNRDAP
jgi:hypothetical protein